MLHKFFNEIIMFLKSTIEKKKIFGPSFGIKVS